MPLLTSRQSRAVRRVDVRFSLITQVIPAAQDTGRTLRTVSAQLNERSLVFGARQVDDTSCSGTFILGGLCGYSATSEEAPTNLAGRTRVQGLAGRVLSPQRSKAQFTRVRCAAGNR